MSVRHQNHQDKYSLYNGDCIEVMPGLPDNSIDISVYSPPFAELYNYSSSDRDLSNCRDYDDFLNHYQFVVNEIYRLTKPGRVTCVHCMDLKGPGKNTWRDFPGDIIRLHEKAGFNYHSRNVIWKEPLKVAIRTRALGLSHRQLCKDSMECKAAGADYLITMRKPGENKVKVSHLQGLKTYAGEDQPPEALKLKYADWNNNSTNKLSHYIFRRYASSVWMDIRNYRVLPYKCPKEEEQEKHVCPLQLDVIERALVYYSNPGELMLTPFLGVGSEVYTAVELGRRGIGVELKENYFRQAEKNVKRIAENPLRASHDLMEYMGKQRILSEKEEPSACEVDGEFDQDSEGME